MRTGKSSHDHMNGKDDPSSIDPRELYEAAESDLASARGEAIDPSKAYIGPAIDSGRKIVTGSSLIMYASHDRAEPNCERKVTLAEVVGTMWEGCHDRRLLAMELCLS